MNGILMMGPPRSAAIGSATVALLAAAVLSGAAAEPGVPPATAAQPVGPRMEFVQAFKSDSAVSRMVEPSPVRFGGEINSLAIGGEFLYVSASKNIVWLKRDPGTGRLAFTGELPLTNSCNLAVAGGRLYTVPTGPGKTMTWYDLDARTGRPAEKGAIECPPSFPIVVGPGGKDLYVKPKGRQKESDKLYWFRIGADGAPAKAGEVAGKGIGGGDAWMLSFTLTADGKFLYSADAAGNAIACIERKPDGEIAYKKAIELKTPETDKPVNFTYPFIDVTPDGKWLYLSMLGYTPNVNYNATYSRNPETGDLTCRETVLEGYGKDHKQFYAKHMVAAFLPDGSGGYWGNCERSVSAFNIDPATGRQVWTGDFPDGRGSCAIRMAFDRENGLLYAGGGPDLMVIQTAKFPAAGK